LDNIAKKVNMLEYCVALWHFILPKSYFHWRTWSYSPNYEGQFDFWL